MGSKDMGEFEYSTASYILRCDGESLLVGGGALMMDDKMLDKGAIFKERMVFFI